MIRRAALAATLTRCCVGVPLGYLWLRPRPLRGGKLFLEPLKGRASSRALGTDHRGEAVGERGCHLGVSEDGGPLGKGKVGRDDDGGALVEEADQVEEQ